MSPGAGTGRAGLRPVEARAYERDPRPLSLCPNRLWMPGAGYRQQRNSGQIRNCRSEGTIPSTLLANEIVSCFSMTEPQGGADPKVFQTKAELRGDNWVINGEKWFSSNARYASFLITMA